MFQTNLAEENLVFPKGSAFFIGCPKEVLEEAMSLLPYEHRYETIYKSKSGGTVEKHLEENHKNDWDKRLEIAKELADHGKSVKWPKKDSKATKT